MKNYNTLIPLDILPHQTIQYGVCRDYSHISRYRRLRQIIHSPTIIEDRLISLETQNPFETSCEISYYTVPHTEKDRLDLIADKLLGSPNYAWVISYFNNIEDGFTVMEGQRLRYPKFITSLFSKGETLAPVNPLSLNLGIE